MKILILFGLPGVGKTFIGNLISEKFDYYFYDADKDLTKEIKSVIKRNKLVSDEMRDKYYVLVKNKLKIIQDKYDKIVVADAIPKEKYRRLLLDNFPDAVFIYVTADSKITKKRLTQRNHIVNTKYAEKVKLYFEEPKIHHGVLVNNSGRQDILKQLATLL